MDYLDAAAAAYGAAADYYRDRKNAAFMEDVLEKLGAIERQTKETLEVVQRILRWTADAPRQQAVYDASLQIGTAKGQIVPLLPGLNETKEIKQHTQDLLLQSYHEITKNILALLKAGGYTVYPTIAVGASLLLVIHAQPNFLSQHSLVGTLKPILDFYRDAIQESEQSNEIGQKRIGWQYLHASEVNLQYPPFLANVRAQCHEDRLFVTGSEADTIEYGGWYAGLNGDWNNGFEGIRSHDGYVHQPGFPVFIKPLPNFKPADGSRTLSPFDLSPWLRVGGSAGRKRGEQIAGTLNNMIQDRNWAFKSEAELLRHCQTLRTLISRLEPIVGDQIAAISADPALAAEYAEYLA